MVITAGLKNYSDKHYTPDDVARQIVDYYKPTGRTLEPCKGDGAFLKYLSSTAEWCEIDEDKDFFLEHKAFDWIVTNPPYSNLTEWMQHSFKLAENVVFFIPLSKLFSSVPRLNLVKDYGGIKDIFVFGSGRSVGLPLGFPMAAVHFQRGYKGQMQTTWHNKTELAL